MSPENEQKRGFSSNFSRANKIFVEHGNFLRIIIASQIQDEADADDFFQELFLLIALKPLPEKINSIRGLLNKIVKDRVKDFYRKKGNYSRRIGRYTEIIKSKDVANGVDVMIGEKEESDKMFDLIRKNLPRKEAQAVALKYQHDCTNKEIASKMDIKPASVRRYVSTGLGKIRKLWA